MAGSSGRQGRNETGRDETPRQVAVALRHERGEIPTVVASGHGHVAERILQVAFATGVKVRQDADLAQLLAAVELDCPIPVNCFEAVAEILNYLYRMNASASPTSPEAPFPGTPEGQPS